MTDSDIIDGIQKAAKERAKELTVGNDLTQEERDNNSFLDRVFVRQVEELLGQREPKGYKRIFRDIKPVPYSKKNR